MISDPRRAGPPAPAHSPEPQVPSGGGVVRGRGRLGCRDPKVDRKRPRWWPRSHCPLSWTRDPLAGAASWVSLAPTREGGPAPASAPQAGSPLPLPTFPPPSPVPLTPVLTWGAGATAARVPPGPAQEAAGPAARGPGGALAQAQRAEQRDAPQGARRAHGPQHRSGTRALRRVPPHAAPPGPAPPRAGPAPAPRVEGESRVPAGPQLATPSLASSGTWAVTPLRGPRSAGVTARLCKRKALHPVAPTSRDPGDEGGGAGSRRDVRPGGGVGRSVPALRFAVNLKLL